MPVPTTLVTGFLGTGKTTTLLELFRHRPADERWAVLVNDFGPVGFDGPMLQDGGYAMREIPGGCICCSAGPQVLVHLNRLLREERPDRLFIEPTGLAEPASLVDMLRRRFADTVELRATVCLVDAHRRLDPRIANHPAFAAQVASADVLVASRADLATPEELAAFHAWASELWPPPLAIVESRQGVLDPAWLDRDPVRREGEDVHAHDHDEHAHAVGFGRRWPLGTVFDRRRLVDVLQTLAADHPALPASWLRIKGVFELQRGFTEVQGDEDTLRFNPSAWRRDSRVDIIVSVGPSGEAQADVEAVLAAIETARVE